MPIAFNEINEKAKGGTEFMARLLDSSLSKEELEAFQIIPSRVRELDNTKHRIFWCHDLPQDNESEHLKNEGWKKFEQLVFVSHWQKDQYINYYGIPPSKCVVLKNAIVPIDNIEKDKDIVRIIYHTTPHRGLELVYHAVDALSKKYKEKIHLDVYSSFKIYGWSERDKAFKELFDQIKAHPNMSYHGSVSNDRVRKALGKSHIFAYPSIWPETSCISLIEAMSAGCLCVHSDLAALPETASNWTYMYDFNEDKVAHANIFTSCLDSAVDIMLKGEDNMKTRLAGQKSYTDLFYNWELRKLQWQQFLNSIRDKPVSQNEEEYFVYST